MGCHENRIAGCLLHDLGGGGVKVGDSRMNRVATYPVLPTDNTVENNVIAGGGQIHFSSNGVWAGIVKGLAVRHNEIRDLPYSGIAVGWCWGYASTSCAGNAIEFNHIHHVMKLIQDGGGIYTLGQQPGTVIRGNVIHDALRGPFACDIGQLGIYLDEGSGPFRIADNLVYRVQMGAFNQHYGRGNVVENNIFALAAEEPITCARKEDHLSFTFRRNIVYMALGDVISKRYNPVRCQTVFEDNLYYDTTAKAPLFGGMTFAEWQASGRDRNSIIADPLFVDAAHDDFRLRPESPASRLGFKPFDPAQAGPEPAYRNVDDPAVRVAPPMLFHLSDGKTLIAFHHNRFSDLNYTGLGDKKEIMKDRSEIWASTSADGGRTWSEPRFVFANALAPSFPAAWRNYQCSYLDMFVDGGILQIFVPHRWHQVLHLTLKESALASLPRRSELACT
jgi:hypothetical protein